MGQLDRMEEGPGKQRLRRCKVYMERYAEAGLWVYPDATRVLLVQFDALANPDALKQFANREELSR